VSRLLPLRGDRLEFIRTYQIHQYGLGGRVEGVGTYQSRPYGTTVTTVDITTDTGVRLSWPLQWVRRDTIAADPVR